MVWVTLCTLDELREGEGRHVEADGLRLAVFLAGGEPHVMDDLCPHAGGRMSEGWVEEGFAVCPLHCWAFDLSSGDLRGGPPAMIRIYPCRLLRRDDGPPLVQARLPLP